MPTINRSWGSFPTEITGTPTESGLEVNAVYGQFIALGSTQTEPVTIDQNGRLLLENQNSWQQVADHITVNASATPRLINASWNLNPYGTGTIPTYICTELVVQIVVEPYSMPVNGQNILNALTGSILEYLQTGPFVNKAYIYGTPAPQQPEPGSQPPSGWITEAQKQKLLAWIDQKVPFEASEIDTYTPFQAAKATYRGVPVGLQDEDRFSPVGSFAFSPLTQTMSDFQNIALISILAALARSEKGREHILHMAEKYMDNVTKMLVAITESGKASPLTALNASTQWATLAHRFGLITDAHYLKMADQTRSLMDKVTQMSWTDSVFAGLSSLVEKTDINNILGGYEAKSAYEKALKQ